MGRSCSRALGTQLRPALKGYEEGVFLARMRHHSLESGHSSKRCSRRAREVFGKGFVVRFQGCFAVLILYIQPLNLTLSKLLFKC